MNSAKTWYAIMSEDVQNSLELRLQHRPAHLARLQALAEENRLLIAGPHPASEGAGASSDQPNPQFTGSLVVAQFESLEQAQSWANKDPFILNGVYARSIVKPFKYVLP